MVPAAAPDRAAGDGAIWSMSATELGKGIRALDQTVAIKDYTPMAGLLTTRGTVAFKDWVPDHDAPVVERLKTQSCWTA